MNCIYIFNKSFLKFPSYCVQRIRFFLKPSLDSFLLLLRLLCSTARKGNVCRPGRNTQQVAVNERPRRRRIGRTQELEAAIEGIQGLQGVIWNPEVGQYSTEVRCRRCQRKWLAITLCVRLPTDYKSLGCTFLRPGADVCGKMHECVQYNEIHLLNVRPPGRGSSPPLPFLTL